MLTAKQHKCLAYLCERAEESAVSPSYEEIREALGLRSKSGVHRLLNALQERGFITKLTHRARSIMIMRTTQGQSYEQLEAENANLRAQLEQAKRDIARLHRQLSYRPREAVADA